jgi:hypothetical protein
MMKKILILLTLIISLNANSSVYKTNIYESYVLGLYFAAGIAMVPIALNWYYPERNISGLYFSQQIDIGMLIEGNIDIRSKLYYHANRIEPGFTYELFKEIGFEALSLNLNYLIFDRRLSVLAGPEYSRIYRSYPYKSKKVNSIGLNIELRYLTNSRFSFSYTGNIKTRPEISKPIVYSGYISVNFRLTK